MGQGLNYNTVCSSYIARVLQALTAVVIFNLTSVHVLLSAQAGGVLSKKEFLKKFNTFLLKNFFAL